MFHPGISNTKKRVEKFNMKQSYFRDEIPVVEHFEETLPRVSIKINNEEMVTLAKSVLIKIRYLKNYWY